jgi:hypothetical protein
LGSFEENIAISANIRSDFALIAKWIGNKAKVLDLGCGEITCFNGHTKDGHLIFRDPTHLTDLGTQTVMNSFDDWYKNQSLHSLN